MAPHEGENATSQKRATLIESRERLSRSICIASGFWLLERERVRHGWSACGVAAQCGLQPAVGLHQFYFSLSKGGVARLGVVSQWLQRN